MRVDAPPPDDPAPDDPPPDAAPAPKAKGVGKGRWGGVRRALPDLIPQPAPAPSAPASGGGIAGAPVDPAKPSHVANLADDSLRELLIESFKIAEIRFANFDKDQAGALMFQEVKRDVAMAGFYDEQKLNEIWRKCDIDRSNMIDFSEFLYMLYMWQYANEIGLMSAGGMVPGGYASAYVQAKKMDLYSAFFKFKQNREIVFRAFSKMENLYKQYDTDGNRKFSLPELRTFMENHLPFVYKAEKSQQLIREFYPRADREIYFHEFLGLMYLCCVEYAPNRLLGTYKNQCRPAHEAKDRFSIRNLRMAYGALETDFKAFDADGNGRLELHELCEGIQNMGQKQKVDFFARLEYQFGLVDLDRTCDLDFYQFCLLAFHTCSDGSYTKLIIDAANGG